MVLSALTDEALAMGEELAAPGVLAELEFGLDYAALHLHDELLVMAETLTIEPDLAEKIAQQCARVRAGLEVPETEWPTGWPEGTRVHRSGCNEWCLHRLARSCEHRPAVDAAAAAVLGARGAAVAAAELRRTSGKRLRGGSDGGSRSVYQQEAQEGSSLARVLARTSAAPPQESVADAELRACQTLRCVGACVKCATQFAGHRRLSTLAVTAPHPPAGIQLRTGRHWIRIQMRGDRTVRTVADARGHMCGRRRKRRCARRRLGAAASLATPRVLLYYKTCTVHADRW